MSVKNYRRNAGHNTTSGAEGNNTKGEHWIGEDLTYDANHTDYDDLRDEEKIKARRQKVPHLAEDDEFHAELESEYVADKVQQTEAVNSDKDTVAERRGYRNRMKEGIFNTVKRQEISRADAIANGTKSSEDDRAVSEVEQELVFGDDIADMEETQGLEGVKKTVRRAIRHEVVDELSEAEAEEDCQPEQPEF